MCPKKFNILNKPKNYKVMSILKGLRHKKIFFDSKLASLSQVQQYLG